MAGYRGLLAFWVGGASTVTDIVEVSPCYLTLQCNRLILGKKSILTGNVGGSPWYLSWWNG